MSRLSEPVYQTICFVPGISNCSYKIIRPTKSFFSPAKGIPRNTVVTLTGDTRLDVRRKHVSDGTFVPHFALYLGIKWGMNMKGTDWITFVRFQRNAVAIPEPARR